MRAWMLIKNPAPVEKVIRPAPSIPAPAPKRGTVA